MKFHGYFRSSAAYRCRIAFNLKGVKPDVALVNLRAGEQRVPEFLKLNPHGLVPALEVDGHTLTQSLAIIEWLEETQPTPALLPKEPFARAHVRALALAIACDMHPLHNVRVMNQLKTAYKLDQSALDSWCQHWIGSGLEAMEATVASSGMAGRFCLGDTPGLADICLMPQMFAARRFGADVSKLTTLNTIAKACDSLPAFADAHPSKQPDFVA